MWIGPGILVLGNYYFVHIAVLVFDKVVSYDHHIFLAVLHIVLVVDIDFRQLPLENNVHDFVLDNYLFEHRVVGMEPVVAMHTVLVEVDKLMIGVVGTVDTVEAVILWVGVGSDQVG